MTTFLDVMQYFNAKKIVHGYKTIYKNGNADHSVYLAPKVEKRGNFYYIGGKKVSKNWAMAALRCDMAVLA